jgi:LacI family transcriptional regulator
MATYASGAESLLRERDYSMLLMHSEGDANLDARHIKFFQSRRVDGMILSLVSEQEPATLESLRRVRIPAVVIDRELPATLGVSSVVSDHRTGTRAATEHLIKLGHRRIGLISGPQSVLPSRERLAGVRDAMAKRGIEDGLFVLEGGFTPEHGEQATLKLLDRPERITAIVVGSNQILIGCLRALATRRIAVGDEISLVSCDDVPLAELMTPPISVVARDCFAVGRTAAELLMRRLAGEATSSKVTLPTEFIPRASSGRARRR